MALKEMKNIYFTFIHGFNIDFDIIQDFCYHFFFTDKKKWGKGIIFNQRKGSWKRFQPQKVAF